jgi:hypothetical protein
MKDSENGNAGQTLPPAPWFGLLVRLKYGHDQLPVMEMLAMPGIDREEAKGIALREVAQPYWCGPRQVIFMRSDGVIELWDRELREGWPNAEITP